MALPQLRSAVLEWYRPRRHAYAWRRGRRSPYRTLVSEVMLQQTQAARVEPIFEAFIARFPDVGTLAEASRADVLRAWAGLGYNRRGVALHEAARVIAREHGGRVPKDGDALRRLPGVGPYTAAAVASIGYDRARGGGRHQRPEDHRASDPRSRVGRGGVRSARSRRAGLARPIGPGGLEPSADGSRARLLPADAALRRLPARVPLSVPCRRPDSEAVRPATVTVRGEHSPGARLGGGGPPHTALGERRGARRSHGPSGPCDRHRRRLRSFVTGSSSGPVPAGFVSPFVDATVSICLHPSRGGCSESDRRASPPPDPSPGLGCGALGGRHRLPLRRQSARDLTAPHRRCERPGS